MNSFHNLGCMNRLRQTDIVELSAIHFPKQSDSSVLLCPTFQKAATCGKKHVWADQWASHPGRTKNREEEKMKISGMREYY